MKVVKSKKSSKWIRLLPYIIGYNLLLTSCTPTNTQANVLDEHISIEDDVESSITPNTSIQNITVLETPSLSSNDALMDETEIISIDINQDEIDVDTSDEIIEEENTEHERKVVALTFDDGPSKYTSELVDILEENNANATFFVIGINIPNNYEGMVKAYENGNEIGVHSYSHTSFTKMLLSDIQSEIDLTRSIIEEYGVVPANLVRPPYGSINDEIKNGIDTSFILWSVDTEDWKSRNVETIKEEVYNAISEGDIILFHDVYPTTIEAISELLPELSDEYEFVTVTELYRRYGIELEPNNKYYQHR